jgi:hypothetical protein
LLFVLDVSLVEEKRKAKKKKGRKEEKNNRPVRDLESSGL